MAELNLEEKNKISHRAMAIRSAVIVLIDKSIMERKPLD